MTDIPGKLRPGFNQTLYENYSNRVRSVTVVGKDAVYYAVEVYEHNEWVTEWSHTVPFGRDQRHRPAGPAFREAASRQDEEAKDWLYVLQPSVTVGEA
jgi:hypothetical protein